MKKITIFLFLVIISSCRDKFNPEKFKGTWMHYDNDDNYFELPSITFRQDSVFLEDVYTHTTLGTYKISEKKITYNLKNDTITHSFRFNAKDSTLFIGKHKYVFWEDYSYDSKFINYKLINFNRKLNITSDSLKKFENGFQLFKDKNDSIKIKLNDKVTGNFDLIPSFVMNSPMHSELFGVIIFMGKGIKLKDLIKCYAQLYFSNRLKIILITDYELETNLYGGFIDSIQFWDFQLEKLFKEKTEMPRTINGNRTDYIKKYNPKIVEFKSEKDTLHIHTGSKNENYIIQLNANLNLKTYVSIKEILKKIRKKNNVRITTEFINL